MITIPDLIYGDHRPSHPRIMERINLSQLKLCDQRWEDMTPNERGRLCAKCSKTIVDFRKMSDSDIARTHAFAEESVCGVYEPKQMRTPKRKMSRHRINKRLSVFMASLGFLFSEQVEAQEPVPKEQTIKREDIQKMQERAGPLDHGPQFQDTLIVTGKVLGERGAPLPFVAIHAKGTKIGTTSDFDGNYTLGIPRDLSSPKDVVLVFTYVGYDTKSIDMGKALITTQNPVVVNMEFLEPSVLAFGVTIGAI